MVIKYILCFSLIDLLFKSNPILGNVIVPLSFKEANLVRNLLEHEVSEKNFILFATIIIHADQISKPNKEEESETERGHQNTEILS